MTLYPVIMCGGAGTRLWPSSRPSRPKQFVPLAGNRTLFQETVLRVAPLATGKVIIVGGIKHRATIIEQLAEIGVDGQLLLEPSARDSAPAMAAAAAWVAKRDPSGIIAFLASDHHVPDAASFRKAIATASSAAADGRIVTLGVKPTSPSSAYGYIRPAAEGLAAVEQFVEKPDAQAAVSYIANGYLWNSGNFISRADVLLKELHIYAPDVAASAEAAIPNGEAQVQVLSADFVEAPKISIDYALMERTRLASVLAVDFEWSDLGAWDAIEATGEGDVGNHVLLDSDHCLVRAPDGVLVAALGVKNLAIVVEADAVLVADMSRAQEVKKIVERVRAVSPSHLDFSQKADFSLSDYGHRLANWLRVNALPLWSAQGQAESGAFAEVLSQDGRSVPSPRRARVQARQIYVFAQAGLQGWAGPWRRAVRMGLEHYLAKNQRPDGLFRTLLSVDDQVLDDSVYVYDQAFGLLALAAAKAAGVVENAEAQAGRLLEAIGHFEVGGPGLKEAGDYPFQSNAHMHLLEACLAWEEQTTDARWEQWSDRVIDLAMNHMIDAKGGFIREYYDAKWRPAAGEDGRLVEPGHQFEWAWLMARYATKRDRPDVLAMAHRLYDFGIKGITLRNEVVIDALSDDGQALTSRARFWPQTEWLKASLILARLSNDGLRTRLLADARRAAAAISLYLTPSGLWMDKRLSGGKFINEAAPASSFYHLMTAYLELGAALRFVGDENQDLSLD